MGFFSRGDHVEVASKEEGFQGSYYSAIVITELETKEYIVQYKTLLKDDLSGPLREVVTAEELRPEPPPITATGFMLYDEVDAYDNDGWWFGKITGKIGPNYFVFFEHSDDEVGYSFDKLRIHQEWIQGKWVLQRVR